MARFKVDTTDVSGFNEEQLELFSNYSFLLSDKPWKIITIPFFVIACVLYAIYLPFYGLFLLLALMQNISEIVEDSTDSIILYFISWPFAFILRIISSILILIPLAIIVVLQLLLQVVEFPFVEASVYFDSYTNPNDEYLLNNTIGLKKIEATNENILKKLPKRIRGRYTYSNGGYNYEIILKKDNSYIFITRIGNTQITKVGLYLGIDIGKGAYQIEFYPIPNQPIIYTHAFIQKTKTKRTLLCAPNYHTYERSGNE